jgi:hypothetical protein
MLDDKEFGAIKEYLESLTGQKVLDKKIRALGVNPPYHGQPKKLIEVGKYYSELEPGAPSEQVIAILESKSFCVCTPTRGAGNGMPYIFTRDTVYLVEESE